MVPLSVGVDAGYPSEFGEAVGVSCFRYAFEVDVGPLEWVWEVGVEVEFKKPVVDFGDSVEGEA